MYHKYIGLNLGMQEYDNMRKPVTVMHQANILKEKKTNNNLLFLAQNFKNFSKKSTVI